MGIKLIASDLDGTIVNEFNHITDANRSAIQKMKEKQIHFAISTGKPYGLMKDALEDYEARFGIFGNGMQIMDLQEKKEIYSQSLSKEELLTCFQIAKKYHLHVHFYTNQNLVTESLCYMDLRNSILMKDHKEALNIIETSQMEPYLQHIEEPVFKFVLSATFDLTAIKQEILNTASVSVLQIKKYGPYQDTVIQKEYEYLDIAPKVVSKGKALSFFTQYLHVERKDTLAVGDNVNDIDMLQTAGTGIAVANAFDEVKHVASYVTTKSAQDSGFAEAIGKYIV